jgi:hypothetical protein
LILIAPTRIELIDFTTAPVLELLKTVAESGPENIDDFIADNGFYAPRAVQ